MPKTWARAEALFQEAVKLPPAERERFLTRLAARDPRLAEEVRSLLDADEHAAELFGELVDPPPTAAVAEMRTVGPYRLVRRLGEGGTSEVYLALRDDGAFQKEVAIKLLRSDGGGPELLRRFAAERQILAALEHPNIARLLDAGTTAGGRPYFVLERVEGLPIDVYCTRNGLGVRERIELFLEVCAAVGYAHQNLVVHRDLKPSNLLVTPDGVPKLLDFGIAKILNPEVFPRPMAHTTTGHRPMTPPYASPEQVRGERITTASDVYSLGVLLYELLAGRLPYPPWGDRQEELERRIREVEPERASLVAARAAAGASGGRAREARRQLAGDLDTILLVALRKEPRRRYGSVEQLADDLKRHLAGRPVAARPDTAGYRLAKFCRRHRFGVAAAAAFLSLAGAFTVAVTVQAKRLASERDVAQLERDKAQQVAGFLQEIFTLSDPLAGEGGKTSAEEILDRAAERLDRELTGQPLLRAHLMVVTAQAFLGLGDYAKAEPLFRAGVEIMKRSLGDGDPDLLDGLNGLAEALIQLQRHHEAEELTREALDSGRRRFGDRHLQVARSLNNLAELVEYQGELATAERLYRQAVAVQRELLGTDDPAVALTLNNLGVTLQAAEKWQPAEAAYREAIDIQRRRLGPVHPHLARTLHNLAVLLRQTGHPGESEALQRQALAMRRETLGEGHPEVAVSLFNLAALLDFEGRDAEAETMYREALEGQRAALGPDHPEVGRVLANLAAMLRDQGRFAEAEAFYRQALDIYRRAGVEEGGLGLAGLIGLGSVLAESGHPAAGEPWMRRGLAGFRKLVPAGHRYLLWAEALYGVCLASLGRREEAEELILPGLPTLLASPAIPVRRKEWLLERTGELYRGWGRPEKAAEVEGMRATLGAGPSAARPPRPSSGVRSSSSSTASTGRP